jgi:hypothetical protein
LRTIVDADLLVVVVELRIFFESLPMAAEQSDAAARDDAFFDGCARRMHRVVNAILALLHFDLGRAADA